MKKVSLGLIGLGYIGKTHLRNCLKLESARLVAVADLRKTALAFARRKGIKRTFRDYNQLLKSEEIDAVIIALPTHLHSACAQDAAEAGVDILLEKPLAGTVEDGKRIVAKARENGVKLMMAYPFRFAPPFRELRHHLLSGRLGEVQGAYAALIGPGPFLYRSEGLIPRPVPQWWFEREKIGGGALLDQGSHLINLLRWYFGEVVDATGYLGYRYGLEVEDHATCILRFGKGRTATINVGWYMMEDLLKVEFYGTATHATAVHKASSKLVAALQLLTGKILPKFERPYFEELQQLVHSITNDSPPWPSGEEGLKDLEAISRVYQDPIRL